jgi:hypothetical protein
MGILDGRTLSLLNELAALRPLSRLLSKAPPSVFQFFVFRFFFWNLARR